MVKILLNNLLIINEEEMNSVLPDEEEGIAMIQWHISGLTFGVNPRQMQRRKKYIGLSDDKQIPQLRISARVQNKQKRDEVSLSSADGFRKVINNSQDEDEDEEKECNLSENVVMKTFKRKLRNIKKRRRTWELWSPEDKKAFFEALNECGKDFESIQNLICKLRKKESQGCIIKNKDQVRHFYYRTWHKISKHVKFSNDVNKATQELYALINYGELRKKVGGTLDEKKGQKLQELIQTGSTSVRLKGKCIRIKTPICRTLKKLNGVEEEREHCASPIPMSIKVDITPKNTQAWNHVQSMSHNPRVQVLCSMHKPIANIIDFLQQRWKCSRSKIRENLVSTVQFPINVAPQQTLFLRLVPSGNTIIKQVHVKPDSQVKSYAVSFLSHAQRLQKNSKLSGSIKKERSRKNSQGMISPPVVNERKDIVSDEYEDKDDGIGGEISQEETEGSDIEFEDDQEPSCSDAKLDIKEEPTSYLSYSEDEEEEEIQMLTPIPEIKVEREESDDAITQLMALESVANFDQTQDDEVMCLGENTRLLAQVRDSQPPKADDDTAMEDCETASLGHEDEDKVCGGTVCPKESYDDYVKRVRKGWTAKAIAAITVGQLFLMFGEDQKLSLEYCFEETEEIDVEMDSAATDVDMDCTPLEDASYNNVSSKGGTEKNCSDQPSSLNFEDNNNILLPQIQDEMSSRVFNGCRVSFLDNVSSKSENSSPIVSVSDAATPNVLGSPPSTLKTSGLPLPDLVDIGASSPKAEREEEEKNPVPDDISRMMNRLFGLMKSLSSPQESCLCRLMTVTRTPTGSLRSPIGTRCGSNLGKGSSATKSPRGLASSTRSPRTPTQSLSAGFPKSPGQDTSAVTHRSQKLKPSSAKRLLTDLPEKMSLNVKESSCLKSNSVADTVQVASDQELVDSLTSKVTVEVPTASRVEFRVPSAPAPRTVCQTPNSNFNVQLSKLMPRYSMPSRRAMRKNMVVQRQLPLLPRLPQPHPGYVTLKVLPSHNEVEDIKYSPDAQKLSPLIMKLPAVSTNANNGFSAETEARAIIGPSPSLSSEKTMSPLLVQQLTVPAHLLPVSNVTPFEVAPIAISTANAISVNVSGHQLLTVEMPNTSQRILNSVSNLIHKPAIQVSSNVSSSPFITTVAHSGTSVTFLSTATTTTPTTFAFVNTENLLPINSNTPDPLSENFDSLSSFLNETLGPMTYLSDPICSTKDINTPSNFKGVFSSVATSGSAMNFECPSDILLGKSKTNPVTSTASLIAPCENSLLNTPIRLLPSDSVLHKNVESVKLNISSLLDSPETSLNQSDEQIPQIHIPDCNTSLPLFDISIGGTISVCETIKGCETLILPSESAGEVNLHEKRTNNELTLSVTCVTSSVVTSEADMSKQIVDDLSLQAFQDNSCDKMMDITLANSNSNSCFSSLLAATSGSIPPLDSLLENSLLQTPPRPSLRTGRMSLESERFDSLSAVPPSPPSSPSRLLHQNDAQWLQHDANEFSLSSLLGSMESPCKSGSSVIPSSEGSLSLGLISALNDNTVDFTSTFARLKNQTKDPNF